MCMSAFIDVTISAGVLTIPAPTLTAATASSAQLITAAQANANYDAVQPINVRVVSEGGAGVPDTITSITGLPDGREVRLTPRDAGSDITVTHSATLPLIGGFTTTMVAPGTDVMSFIQNGANTVEIARNF